MTQTMTQTTTTAADRVRRAPLTFREAVAASGWATSCARSPLPDHPRRGVVAAKDVGWEPCPYDRQSTPGYEYGVMASSSRSGFAGRAAATYYRRMRRRAA